MKTRFFVTLAILTYSTTMNAQAVFQKTFGGSDIDNGMSVHQTTDGGYMLFGQTFSFGNGNLDMYLVKTDNLGIEQWYKTYGGTNWEFGISAQQTKDGGYILCGGYSGLINDSLALIKTDANGNVSWNKRYSGSIDREVGQFVQETADGGFIAVGFTGPGFSEDIYFLKTDNKGNELWSKIYGGPGREFGEGVRQTSDGGYAIIGETNSKGNGGKDMYLLKTNNVGDTSWTKTFGTPAHEVGRSLYLTSDGGYILLGYQDSTAGDVFLVKTDAFGNEQWHKYYGGTGSDKGHSVQQTADGGYVLAGLKGDSIANIPVMYCIKTNNLGIVQWEYTYPKGVMSDAYAVEQTADGGYILLGSTIDSIGGTFTSDMYLVKIGSDGILSILENKHQLNLSTYPNPFTEYTTVEFENAKKKEFNLRVFNLQGQLVKTMDGIQDNHIIISRNNLDSGMYFFQLLSENKIVGNGKLMVE